MNCRKSGDAFEYAIVYFLKGIKAYAHDRYSEEKEKRLLDKWDSMKVPLRKKLSQAKKIDRAIASIVDSTDIINTYTLVSDDQGRIGDTSDIKIHTSSGKVINISCKNNNLSIKHQRPSNLGKQMNLSDADTRKYREKYMKVNDRYREKWQQYERFNQIDKDQKWRLYRRVNKVVRKQIKRSSTDCQEYFVKYLMSADKDEYIMKWSDQTNTLELVRLHELGKRITDVTVDENVLAIHLEDVKITMRLHTASSKITKTLSLKYDTKIENMMKVFKTMTF